VARIGGDEFAVLLPETDKQTAREAVERLQVPLQLTMKIHLKRKFDFPWVREQRKLPKNWRMPFGEQTHVCIVKREKRKILIARIKVIQQQQSESSSSRFIDHRTPKFDLVYNHPMPDKPDTSKPNSRAFLVLLSAILLLTGYYLVHKTLYTGTDWPWGWLYGGLWLAW
jgi:hypothetical protein